MSKYTSGHFNGSTASVLGVPISKSTMSSALDLIDECISARRKLHIGVVNVAKIVNMSRNPELRTSVLESDVVFVDGLPVVWASRLLGESLPERLAGIDLMHGILERGNSIGRKVYCLGATDFVVQEVVERFGVLYPGVDIVGYRNGYFTKEEEKVVAEEIRDSGAEVLFVAITSPKKERFMADWSETMSVPVVHGVGGSFDVVAGLVKRAPESWQNLGLEWLYRVKQEPRRLWRRYLVTNSRFVWMVARALFSRVLTKIR